MARSKRRSLDPIEYLRGLPRSTTDAMKALFARYPDWVRDLPTDESVYAISSGAINGLALVKMFPRKVHEAEREFTRICNEQAIVGIGFQRTIVFPLLSGRPHPIKTIPLDDFDLQKLGWLKEGLGALEAASKRAGVASDRLLGVVGWLLTEPAFLKERDRLREAYLALPSIEQPPFPLGRFAVPISPEVRATLPPTFSRTEVVVKTDPKARTDVLPTTIAFSASLNQFLDKWGLTGMASWDLPNPQGPLFPDALPVNSTARPAHGIHVYVPVHYPLQHDDELLHQVREFQRQQAVELELPKEFAGIAHHAQYAQMFRILHLEQAIRSRFSTQPRGLVSAVEGAAYDEIGISVSSIQRLRKWTTTCRAGDRATIRKLRDRA